MKSADYRKQLSKVSAERNYRRYLKRKGVTMEGIKLSPEAERKRKVEQDILTIEGLFFAINSAVYSPKFMDALQRGLQMLGNQHTMLLAQMTPEELAEMRAKYNTGPKAEEKINPMTVA